MNFRMRIGEIGVPVHHFRGRFTQNDQAHDHRLLRALVGQKIILAKALDETRGVSGGLSLCCRSSGRRSPSYRAGLGQDLIAELGWQVFELARCALGISLSPTARSDASACMRDTNASSHRHIRSTANSAKTVLAVTDFRCRRPKSDRLPGGAGRRGYCGLTRKLEPNS